MIQALLKSKIKLFEDTLTSAVFGTLEHLDGQVTCDLVTNVSARLDSGGPALNLTPPITWEFWPPWGPDEPDLVISDKDNICIVEAKYGSPFGDHETRGTQLERYWLYCEQLCADSGKNSWLLAITEDISLPRSEMLAQLPNTSPDVLKRIGWMRLDSSSGVCKAPTRLRVNPPDATLGVCDRLGRPRSIRRIWGVNLGPRALGIVRSTEMEFRMSSTPDSLDASFNDLLIGYREFKKSIFELLRFASAEFERRGWRRLKWEKSEWVWRSPRSSTTKKFEGWTDDFAAIAFVQGDYYTESEASSGVMIPEGGVCALVIQIRWLDRSPTAPSAWVVKLDVHSTGSVTVARSLVEITRVMRSSDEQGENRGALLPNHVVVPVSGSRNDVTFSGEYVATPLSEIKHSDDAVTKLIEPALKLFSP